MIHLTRLISEISGEKKVQVYSQNISQIPKQNLKGSSVKYVMIAKKYNHI